MYRFIRDLLFLLPAETSHHLTLNSLKLATQLGLTGKSQAITGREVKVMGLTFPNPIGLAAGLDKNGEYIDGLATFGFGFIEIGTITPRPQPGNPKPRLFRLPEAQAIINRMGFNNEGVEYLINQVKQKNYTGILGINIGKNFDTPVENALSDYQKAMQAVYPYADYITINISSPNTPGLRTLQYGDELKQLLAPLKQTQLQLADQTGRYVPVAVKVAPDLEKTDIADIAEVLMSTQMDALIATNTTLDRTKVQGIKHADEKGGLSGKPLTDRSTEVIAEFYHYLKEDMPIIGVGGISSGQDAKAKIEAGAKLVQVYSGLIYQGAQLVKDCVAATR
ncbi:MAG: hypothetical protein RLZZ422_1712 [Pseudomonadota bacterium]